MVYFGGDGKRELDQGRLTEVEILLSSEFDQENMLEERSFLVSRRLSRSCDKENSWACVNYRMEKIEIQGKRLLESDEDDEVGARKLPKQIDACNSLDIAPTLQEISMIPVDQSGNQRHAGDNSDSSSLIHAIGRDNSISALIWSSRSDYGALASLNKSFRELIRSSELYGLRRQNGVVEHWVYFSCQLLGWEAFDPTSRRWMRLSTMTSDECFMFSDKESLAVGTELLVFGAFLSPFIFKYSLLTNTWSSGMNMNFPRCMFGSASVGEIAILAGGCDLSGNTLSVAELYNSELGTWETLPNMNKTRKMCSAVFIDGKFYVIGGIGGSDS